MSHVRIAVVEGVNVIMLRIEPPSLAISSSGRVNSSGWSHGELQKWIFVQPPSDGVHDFDFIAKEPAGIQLPKLMPIYGDSIIDNVDIANYWGEGRPLRGIRIHAATNSVMYEIVLDKLVGNQEGAVTKIQLDEMVSGIMESSENEDIAPSDSSQGTASPTDYIVFETDCGDFERGVTGCAARKEGLINRIVEAHAAWRARETGLTPVYKSHKGGTVRVQSGKDWDGARWCVIQVWLTCIVWFDKPEDA